MNTARQNFTTEHDDVIIFKIIRGGKYFSKDRSVYIDQLWIITKAALWPSEQFSEKETAYFKKLLGQHLENCLDMDARFKELVERIVMAKRYVERRPWRYLPRPAEWLDVNCSYGLAGTRTWYIKEEIRRAVVPAHNYATRLLARALHDYCQRSDSDGVTAWVKQLHQMQEADLLCLYVAAVMQLNESKK